MIHNFFFSGKTIDLDQNATTVENDMQAAIDQYFPVPNKLVKVKDYKELDDKTFEFTIERSYKNGAGTALGGGWICDQDMSLLTGLPVELFQPFDPKTSPLIAPLIPWHDNMVYGADDAFADLWKLSNELKTKEKIGSIFIQPGTYDIYVKVEYGNGKKRRSKKDKGHDVTN